MLSTGSAHGQQVFTKPSSETAIAQSLPQAQPRTNPTQIPTDITPTIFRGENSFLSRNVRLGILRRLPSRLWITGTAETSQRYETNVFFTRNQERGDYVFRVLPNLTAGYDVYKKTSLYCNYFVIKDLFAINRVLNFPTTQSLSVGLRRDFLLSSRNNLQLDFQARELWQTAHLRQADLIPTVSLTHVVNPSIILFASSLLQMRSAHFFQGPTRELDPFYSAGLLVRRGAWILTATDTFVTNYRSPPFRNSIPRQGNFSMIADFEVSRPVFKKFPALMAFMRVEPVWNWRSNNVPGLSGFDFRFFSGLRFSVSKRAYNDSIERMRQQLKEAEQEAPTN